MKRIVKILALIPLIFLLAGGNAQCINGVQLGDVNTDGRITDNDCSLVRMHILGLKPLVGSAAISADVNQDGIVTISDYTLIRLHVLGVKIINNDKERESKP